MHILTLLALLTLLSLAIQLLVSDKVDAVHYGLVLLAGVDNCFSQLCSQLCLTYLIK